MAHENLKTYLYSYAGKRFVADLTHKVYPNWSHMVPSEHYHYRIFEELTVRFDTGEQTRLGLDKTDHYRFDCVFFVEPGYRALNQHQIYTVGIELKYSANDLKYDKKIQHYLGWTDFFFLGVPSELEKEAEDKIFALAAEYPESKRKIGLLLVDKGEIILQPLKQTVSASNMIDVQNQVIYNCIFKDIKAVHFTLEDIEIESAELHSEYVKYVPSTLHDEDETTSEEVLSSDDTTTPAPESTPEQPELTSEELAEAKEKAKQQRVEAAAKQAARLAHLADRATSLPTSVAKTYNSLKPTDKEVFWSVVDGKEHRGDIADSTGLSVPAVAKSLETLIKSDMVLREGGKKHGHYIVGVSTDKRNACETCNRLSCVCRGAADGNCAHHS